LKEAHVIFGRTYPRRYDVIVIGGGIGGLVCANLLGRGGMRVLLLEKHYALGGFCSSFRRQGFLFDAATHFYPLLGNPNTLTGKVLRQLEIPTEWIKMDPVDQFHIPGLEPFAVPASFSDYIRKLKHWFPHEALAIDCYFAELQQAYMYGLLYYFRGVSNEYVERLEHYTMADKLAEHFSDAKLKAVLMADTSHWGSIPSRTSYLFDAMLRLSYFLGNYYPRGGSQTFADDLGRGIESRGGKVLRCAAAERILVSGGAVCGVRIHTVSHCQSTRYEFHAPVVVSNADALHTYRDLLPAEYCDKSMLDRIYAMRPSYPCFLMHIGLRGMDPSRLAAAEGYYWSSHDPDDVIRNVFKIFVPTHFDPSVAPPGCQILVVQKVTPVNFPEVADWKAHKEAIENTLMQQLRRILPGIDSHIMVRLAASAFTSYRFTGNREGAMLGWEMSPDQLGPRRLPFSTPVRNLYLTGHWTQPGGGITPVIISAQRISKTILTERDTEHDLAAQCFGCRASGPSLEEGRSSTARIF
jgi:phytoene dehydrogenase-like protein